MGVDYKLSDIMNYYLRKFQIDVESVKSLMDFDKTLLEIVTKQLEGLATKLKGKSEIAHREVIKSIAWVENIRSNNSLQGKYTQIYNSCLVLLVAYFSEVLKLLFVYRLQQKIDNWGKIFESDKLKLNFEELKKYDFNLKKDISRVITDSLKISFQDMQSTCRCFKEYIDYEIKPSRKQSNIIVAQAARHVIVHADWKINKDFLNQVRTRWDRDLLPKASEGDSISLNKSDIDLVIKEMSDFIEELEGKTTTKKISK